MSGTYPKILTAHLDEPDSHTLAAYVRHGGYGALRKALRVMDPKRVTQEVKASNLRGRGGAGFPTGVKWGFLPKQTDKPVYLAVNADEGEPGTFKDRMIMERNPHALIEGCLITCYAIGSSCAYIYIRGELWQAAMRLERAIEAARDKGFIGRNILGSGFDCQVYVHRGAGAYVCGEETAMLESLEGKTGQPRNKPPFPALVGAFGCPTIVNNVETIAYVPWITDKGGEAFAELGCERNGGLKIWGVSGHVKRPGLWEAPMGISMQQLIYDDDFAGGMRGDRPIKGCVPGGSSCPPLNATDLESDIVLSIESVAKAGSMMGTGCLCVFEQGVCTVRLAARISRFYRHESCGQCTPCREGTGWLARNVAKLERGETLGPEGVGLLESICARIMGNTICALGDAAAMPILGYVKKYRDEWEAHHGAGRCPVGD